MSAKSSSAESKQRVFASKKKILSYLLNVWQTTHSFKCLLGHILSKWHYSSHYSSCNVNLNQAVDQMTNSFLYYWRTPQNKMTEEGQARLSIEMRAWWYPWVKSMIQKVLGFLVTTNTVRRRISAMIELGLGLVRSWWHFLTGNVVSPPYLCLTSDQRCLTHVASI